MNYEFKKYEQEVIDKYVTGDILDLGCGYGRLYPYLKDRKSYTGIDISIEGIKKAKKDYPEGSFEIMGAETTTFKDNQFDCVFAGFNVLDEIDNLDDTLEEIKRILKPNGTLVFSFHNSFYWKHLLRSYPIKRNNKVIYPMFQTIRQMTNKINEYFTSEKVYGNNLTPYPYMVCKNVASSVREYYNKPLCFNIYGFKIKVEGNAKSSFFREYKYFIDDKIKRFDLVVKPLKDKKVPFLIKPNGSKKGLFIDFHKKRVLYEEGLSPDFVIYYSEPFIEWEDKTLLHAGAVEKNGNAILFPAGSGVGKTAMTLYLSKLGFNYLSDDWIIVGNNKAYPFFKTMHVFDYNLNDSDISKKVLGWKRFYYKLYFGLINILLSVSNNKIIRFGLGKLKKDFKVDIKTMFGDNMGVVSNISKIFWLKKSKDEYNSLEKCSIKTFAEQISYVMMYEHNHFYKVYQRYAYLFGKCDYIENRQDKIKRILGDLDSDIYELEVQDKIVPSDIYNALPIPYYGEPRCCRWNK